MPDREMVMNALELCIQFDNSWNCPDKCPYYGKTECNCYTQTQIMKDALELLKEHPPAPRTFHVIDRKTGKEADTYEIALHEDWAKGMCYFDMEGWALEEDGSLLLTDECGVARYADRDRFEVVWDE